MEEATLLAIATKTLLQDLQAASKQSAIRQNLPECQIIWTNQKTCRTETGGHAEKHWKRSFSILFYHSMCFSSYRAFTWLKGSLWLLRGFCCPVSPCFTCRSSYLMLSLVPCGSRVPGTCLLQRCHSPRAACRVLPRDTWPISGHPETSRN